MQFKESEIIELKKSTAQIENSLEDICAFCNHKGGMLYFGINEIGKVVGQDISDSTLKRISQLISQKIKPEIQPIIKELVLEGKKIIEVKIPEGLNKPYSIDGKAYKRIGSETRVMSFEELKKSLKWSVIKDWAYEICEQATFKDIDLNKVKEYLKMRDSNRNVSSKLSISIKEILENINATKKGKPTNAGILFFGKMPLKYIPQAQLRLARIKGLENYNDILDRFDCQGTLWEMVNDAELFIKRNINLLGLRTNKFKRIDKFEYPIKALREAIINALIHRDYLTPSDVRVFIFDNRIEVINPGTFPDDVTPKKPKHKPVNPLLANYMYDIGFIEKYGSGINLENNLCVENGNKKPRYDLSSTIETKAIFDSQLYKRIFEDYPEKVTEKVTENQVQIIELIQNDVNITISKLSEILQISPKNIKENISKLKQKGILERIGPDKGGYWKVINKK